MHRIYKNFVVLNDAARQNKQVTLVSEEDQAHEQKTEIQPGQTEGPFHT